MSSFKLSCIRKALIVVVVVRDFDNGHGDARTWWWSCRCVMTQDLDDSCDDTRPWWPLSRVYFVFVIVAMIGVTVVLSGWMSCGVGIFELPQHSYYTVLHASYDDGSGACTMLCANLLNVGICQIWFFTLGVFILLYQLVCYLEIVYCSHYIVVWLEISCFTLNYLMYF